MERYNLTQDVDSIWELAIITKEPFLEAAQIILDYLESNN